MSHLNYIQRFLVALSIFSLVIFIVVNIYISFKANTNNQILGVNVSDTISKYKISKIDYSTNTKSSPILGERLVTSNVSGYSTDYLEAITANGELIFLPSKVTLIESGDYLLNLNDETAIELNNYKMTSIGKSQVLLSINGYDLKAYVLSGSVITSEGKIAEEDQKLTWLVDQFGVSFTDYTEFKKDLNFLNLFYQLYEIKLLPNKLVEYVPSV